MDSQEILKALTSSNEEFNSFGDKLDRILQKILPHMPENGREFVQSGNYEKYPNIRLRYLRAIVFVLEDMQKLSSTDNEELFSVNQFRTTKAAVELIVSIGIVPCLLRGVGVNMAKLCPRALQISQDNLSDLEKYDLLSFSTSSLLDLYKDVFFRPAILAQLGPLLAALLQLSCAPLMKPASESSENKNVGKDEFVMTNKLYAKLRKDQEHFTSKLEWLQENCPGSAIVKELMVILGIKESPNWLKRETRKYLIQKIMQPDGITVIIGTVCDGVLDLGEHWNKLDTISRLIATSHGNHPDYYKSVCRQLLELLASKQIKHSATIANCCIVALHEYKPEICIENIFKVITAPLSLTSHNENLIHNESEVELCVESLTKCFITVEAKFKQLPSILLSKVALPLFSLYNDIMQSACILKNKIKQLILKLLYDETLRSQLFPELLGHKVTGRFGYFLNSRFGSNGSIEIIGIAKNAKYEEFVDTLFDLVLNIEQLSVDVFSYLLKCLPDSMKSTGNVLETEEDTVERIGRELSTVKLLSNLANTSIVQEAQIKKPEPLFSFIKLLFDEHIKESSAEDDDCEILYISLMLVKMILSERKQSVNWDLFNDFAQFLRKYYKDPNVPMQLLTLTKEVVELIEKQGKGDRRHYQDLSVDRKASNKFEQAIRDLQDPLLPVRGHGLITLTKLIETMDPCAITQKAIVLRLFQENLKHEDSFIYLAAINGMCVLATSYPKVVVETLVQEFIDMPQRISSGDLNTETRLKLGEVLVKTTRALGEMAIVHKNTLVNGFLCAIRDPDPMVRASSLSCLGELCKVLGFRLGDILIEVIYCISCIIKSDKAAECRRAAVLVSTLLLRGLGKDTLTSLGRDLVDLYRGLKHLQNNDEDPVLRLHAQLALEELDDIVKDFLFAPPKLERRIFLLESR